MTANGSSMPALRIWSRMGATCDWSLILRSEPIWSGAVSVTVAPVGEGGRALAEEVVVLPAPVGVPLSRRLSTTAAAIAPTMTSTNTPTRTAMRGPRERRRGGGGPYWYGGPDDWYGGGDDG